VNWPIGAEPSGIDFDGNAALEQGETENEVAGALTRGTNAANAFEGPGNYAAGGALGRKWSWTDGEAGILHAEKCVELIFIHREGLGSEAYDGVDTGQGAEPEALRGVETQKDVARKRAKRYGGEPIALQVVKEFAAGARESPDGEIG
jgi:hypothetical protein